VLDDEPQRKMFAAMGLDIEVPSTGCCGHAGSFGYEAEHYDVSQAIAEQVLLPAVRKAKKDTIVIADGFSCRQQIKDGTGRWPMHPAEVLAMALDSRGSSSDIEFSERRYLEPAARLEKKTLIGAAVAVAAVAVVGVLVAERNHHRL
jgi:hypothetical protein